MTLYVAVPVVLVALFFAASGVAGITRGWVLPANRRPVYRPRLYGWGQLVGAVGLCWHVLFWLGLSNPDTFDSGIRQWEALSGIALVLAGFILVMVSRRGGGNREGSGTL